ncbi:MAG: Ig-like domain-containing protein [Gammaproteobacteria bacterium]|nr:Ig-like domain-containing protein [Gammaproteobacteria bacterium]
MTKSHSHSFLKYIIFAIILLLEGCRWGSNDSNDSNDNTSPVVGNDTYDTFGNTLLEVGVTPSGTIAVKVSGSVLDNDADSDGPSALTVSSVGTPVFGSVTMDADGHFSYTPPDDNSPLVDNFSYEASDGGKTSTGMVSINITEQIWYVDNRSSSGMGTSDDPFASLTETELVAVDGDTVYIANGDGTTLGLDNGLTIAVPNVTLIGEGAALVINSTTLAAAGTAPSITNTSGTGITLNAADNTQIMGLTINGVSTDGLVINDSTGVVVNGITISNSGESAIQGSGADIGLTLTDVTIDTVDVADPLVSDDAIFITATASASLVMSGGSINGVPGNLGDGIVFKNADVANAVSMSLDVRGVIFSNIRQDGIKLDNDNGVVNAQIGGSTAAEGNFLNAGFRGVQIQTSDDPTLSRTNSILIQNNTITSENESIQIRNIDDITNLSILDNVLNRATPGTSSDLIDIQAEFTANPQVRIYRNDINNLGGNDGIKVRVFDGATLTMEALNNDIDGPFEGFDFDVIDATSATTTLNTTVLNNTLSSIVNVAMNARNANTTSQTCMDLQGNSVLALAPYELDAVFGSFALTAASQAIVFNPAGGSVSDPGTCAVPTF